jgi:hypothetical protein
VTAVLQTVVETTTLDEQLHENVCPDLIKIDVEGADLAVMEGGRNMLERCRPIIFYEASNFLKTRLLLENLGYKLFDGRTFQPIGATGAFNVVALHQQKHFTCSY